MTTALEADGIPLLDTKARFETFETSAAIIQRAGWKLVNPQTQRIANEEECHAFIKSSLETDKRRNLFECRLRVLCVYLDRRDQISKSKPLLKTAEDFGWTYNGFTSLVDKGTTGSAMLSSVGKISLFFQTPRDNMPFVAFSMTELPAEARKHASDWVCLLFATTEIDLKALLRELFFPPDFSPLPPDFMYLAVRILEDQVETIRDGLRGPLGALEREEEKILQMKASDFGRTRRVLFDIEKQVRELQDRWQFAQGLSASLLSSFDEIVAVNRNVPGRGQKVETYSKTLLNRVDTQKAIIGMLRLEFDSIPAAIEEQHRKIEAELNLMIAHNSFVSAEEARRDGSSMKTIAAITLIFLPSTTVASIFSMSMFNWSANDGDPVISHRFWIYVIVALGLTAIVLGLWILWFTRNRNRNNAEREVPWRSIDPAVLMA